ELIRLITQSHAAVGISGKQIDLRRLGSAMRSLWKDRSADDDGHRLCSELRSIGGTDCGEALPYLAGKGLEIHLRSAVPLWVVTSLRVLSAAEAAAGAGRSCDGS